MSFTTVAMTNLGCRANQYDGTYMVALLKSRRFQLVDFKEKADIYIINTCTVTDRADADSRNLIRRAHRRNPEAITVVTGCYAQTAPQEVAKIEGVQLILGNSQKSHLLDYLELARQSRDQVHIKVDPIFQHDKVETFGGSSFSTQSRAYVKIQDGCNQFCSFCIIPFARGKNRSVSIEKVIEELRQLREAGFHEAVLTGIHIGTYGADLPSKQNLNDLLEAIEIQKPIDRVRISSIDPEEVNEGMIEILSQSSVFCPHLHIPLQSGDNAILKLMRRRYQREDFTKLCTRLVKQIPRLNLGTDVMVGFPYEDEVKFQNTYDLLKESPVAYFHVFPYSSKKGTPAAKMMGQVPPEIKKQRAAQLRELSEQKSLAFRQKFLGKELEVILERTDKTWQNGTQDLTESHWVGTSANFLPVKLLGYSGQRRGLVPCKIESIQGGRLVGRADQG